jgi:periplasmic divalent cation tolerance protein
MADYVQVQTTLERRADAERLAKALVERRLAACVQILGPIQSMYRWKGGLETAEEWLCLIKTRRDFYPRVEQAILELHPYEVPEIVVLPITTGSKTYLAWLEDQLEGGNTA